MAFRIDITQKALADIGDLYAWIEEEQSEERAIEWFQTLSIAVDSLEEFPGRCSLAPEGKAFSLEIRQLLFGKRRNQYRLLFQIEKDTVFVLRIRHSASRSLNEPELKQS